MKVNSPFLKKLIGHVCALHKEKDKRILIAFCGAPASGKSTLSDALLEAINSGDNGIMAAVLPMDGFHLDNRILQERGLLDRKGAPNTFDADGFCQMVSRLRDNAGDIIHPVFDRGLDMAIAGAGEIKKDVDVVIVEGNYLLLDDAPWSSLVECFDYTVMVAPGLKTIEERLIQRWLDNGLSLEDAQKRANFNDLPNAKYIDQHSRLADICIDN